MNHRIISAVLSLSMMITTVVGCSEANTAISISDTLSVAERFLSEMKYEQAIIEFDKILSVEPKNADAYLGKAEAYIALGDNDSAVKTLKSGYEQTGDERIKARLDEVSEYAGASLNSTMDNSADATEENENIPKTVVIAGKTYSTDETSIYCYDELSNEDLKLFLNFQDLKVLVITKGGNITDISPLTALINLEYLSLDACNIYDLSSLKKLVNLKHLDLRYCNISDISSIAELKKLEILDISHNQISDISPLSELVELVELDIGDNNIDDISPITGLSKLTALDLHGNDFTDISGISNLSNLTRLNLGMVDSKVSDISFVSALTELKDLSIGDTVDDISAISNLNKLENLYIGCALSDLRPIASLTELKDLRLSNLYSSFTSMEALAGLTKLNKLNIEFNDQPMSLSPLSYLTELTELTVVSRGNDTVYDVDSLSNLKRLKTLDLTFSGDYDTGFLLNMSELEKMSLSIYVNDRDDLNSFTNLKKLKELYLHNTGGSIKEKLKELLSDCQIN